MVQHGLEVQPRRAEAVLQAVMMLHRVGHQADRPHAPLVHHDMRRGASGQADNVARSHDKGRRRRNAGDERLECAAQVAEGPGGHQGQFDALVGHFAVPGGEHGGQFEQAHLAVAGVLVGFARPQQARPERRAQDVVGLSHGGIDSHEAVEAEHLGLAGVGEAVGQGLVEPGGGQEPPDLAPRALRVAFVGDGVGHVRADGYAVEAVHPGHFLDEVGLALQVRTVRRDRADDPLAVGPRGQAQAVEDLLLALRRNVDAEQRAAPRRPHGHGPGLKRIGPDVDHARGQRSAGEFHYHLAGPQRGGIQRHGVHAALEAVVALAHQAQFAAGAACDQRVELRRLDQHVGRRGVDLGGQPAHDPRDGHRPGRVGYHEHVLVEAAGGLVDGDHDLPRPPAANDDLMALQLVVIETVQRLGVFHQDVVGHVDHVVDGPQPGGLEPLDEPRRARAYLHALDDPGGVARAQVGRLDDDLGQVRRVGPADGHVQHRRDEGLAQHGGGLAGHAKVAQAVRAVRRDLQVQDDVRGRLDDLLAVEPDIRQDPGQVPDGNARDVHVVRQPVQRYSHGSTCIRPGGARRNRIILPTRVTVVDEFVAAARYRLRLRTTNHLA